MAVTLTVRAMFCIAAFTGKAGYQEPGFFDTYAGAVMPKVLEDFEDRIKIEGRNSTNLRYADDTTLMCGSRERVLKLLKSVKDASDEKGSC